MRFKNYWFAAIFGLVLAIALPSYAQNNQIFYDGFEGNLNQNWQVSQGYGNDPNFGFGCQWSLSEVWTRQGLLNVNINDSKKPIRCGELKTNKSFRFGSFVANMKPLDLKGTVSSFFLYTGTKGGAPDHFEIDIEFLKGKNGQNLLHTNYWIQGKQYPEDIDLDQRFGINPYSAFRRYGFEWRSNKIVWFLYDDNGNWKQLRQADVALDTNQQDLAMPLFMNNWNSSNQGTGTDFPGPYAGGGGAAQYDYVWIGD